MDLITHALLGFALSRAGFNRLTRGTAWVMIVAALLPDLDHFLPFEWQRKITHCWFLVPVLGFWAVAISKIILRRHTNWIGGWIAGSAAVCGHLILDSLTSRGVAWFWPFSEKTVHFDLIRFGDPWIACLLLLAVIAPFLSRMVSSEIGARQSPGTGTAIFSLLLVFLYLGGRMMLSSQAETTLKSRIYEGNSANRIAVVPDAHNPFSWTGLVETETFIRVLPVSALGTFDPDQGLTIYPPDSSPALEAARSSGEYLRLQNHFQWPHWQVIPSGDSCEVRLEDLQTGLSLQMEFDENLREVIKQRSLRYPGS